MTPTRIAFNSITRPVRRVEVPGAAAFHVRALTVAEMRRFQAHVIDMPEGPARDEMAGLWLCLFSLCEEDGTAVFPAPVPEYLKILEDQPAFLVDAIAEAAAEVNRPDKVAAKN